jgi:hypothetical protein
MATDSNGNIIFGRYNVGLHNVGSYQVSGYPFLTGSAIADTKEEKISFPTVTKSITVKASSSLDTSNTFGEMRIHFASALDATHNDIGVYTGHHYFVMDSDEDAMTFDVKCKEIYISALGDNCGFELYASLTGIPTASMCTLTGSGITEQGDEV